MKTTRTTQGFTLIELMIVVAIIGILSAIAVPQYQDYVGKSQVAEALALLDGLKSKLAEAISETGDNGCVMPASAVAAGSYVGAVTVSGTATACVAKATYKPTVNTKVANKYLQFTYNANTGSWLCATDLPLEIKPKHC